MTRTVVIVQEGEHLRVGVSVMRHGPAGVIVR